MLRYVFHPRVPSSEVRMAIFPNALGGTFDKLLTVAPYYSLVEFIYTCIKYIN